MEVLLDRFPDFAEMSIVDLGGDVRYWQAQSVRPAHVTIVSVDGHTIDGLEPWMSGVLGDACDIGSVQGRFDLVFSNSVIEHVGGSRYRRGFAEVVHGLSDRHWIQTPYRYFPLEPHFKFPAFQFLPLRLRVRIAQNWKPSFISSRPEIEPVGFVADHELLGRTEMRALFPESEIIAERVGGLTKSLIAVKA
jgi:hypothetical protein